MNSMAHTRLTFMLVKLCRDIILFTNGITIEPYIMKHCSTMLEYY